MYLLTYETQIIVNKIFCWKFRFNILWRELCDLHIKNFIRYRGKQMLYRPWKVLFGDWLYINQYRIQEIWGCLYNRANNAGFNVFQRNGWVIGFVAVKGRFREGIQGLGFSHVSWWSGRHESVRYRIMEAHLGIPDKISTDSASVFGRWCQWGVWDYRYIWQHCLNLYILFNK